MSAIAMFHLVRNGDVDQLQQRAAQPVGPVRGGPWSDPYWDFLKEQTRELEPYDWSGYVLGSEVYYFLESKAAAWDAYCDDRLTDALSQARGSTVLAFRSAPAHALAEQIDRHRPDGAELQAFLASPEISNSPEEAVPVEAVADGLQILRTWLRQVDENHVGLLTIG